MAGRAAPTDDDYRRLLAVRTGLRRLQHSSELQAAEAGVTPAQNHLLLVVRASDDSDGPAIGEIADALLLRHHSAVELVDRAESAGLVKRMPDSRDRRRVRVKLTAAGRTKLRKLASRQLDDLEALEPLLRGAS